MGFNKEGVRKRREAHGCVTEKRDRGKKKVERERVKVVLRNRECDKIPDKNVIVIYGIHLLLGKNDIDNTYELLGMHSIGVGIE